MASSREPPPLLDSSEDDHDDPFVSALQTQSLSSGAGGDGDLDARPPPPPQQLDEGEEIRLDEEESSIPEPPTRDSALAPGSPLPQPIRPQPAPRTAQQATSSPPQGGVTAASEADDHFIEISVTDPQKIGDGMGAYVAYKVTTRTNYTFFKKSLFSVMRRFSDFLGLHDKLAEKHTRVGRIVPPAPEKSVIGMTKIKMSKDSEPSQPGQSPTNGMNSGSGSNEFVERRRAALERFLQRVAAHPTLLMDPDYREFLELQAELPKATNTSALSSAGVLRLFNFVGDTVSKMTIKMDETDPWFEEKQQQVENWDQQMRKLHSSIEALVTFRRELTLTTSMFAKSAAMLSNCEEHNCLSRALSQLAEVEEKIENTHSEQASHDFYVLAELMKDYIALLGSVKDIFHQRVKVYQTWQHAQQMLTRKREAKAKLELTGKTDKLPQAREEVTEWESKVERGQEEFENISKMIRKEMERFEFYRVNDFKNTITKYMELIVGTQQKTIKYWETFLPEAKAIV